MSESRRYWSFKFHSLMSDGMSEAKHIGMQAKTMQRVVAITIFYISAHRMPHICRMNPYLVFPSRFESVFHERVLSGAVEHMEMRYGIFSAVIHRR